VEDKELFEFWERKIKTEISSEIISEKLTCWKLFHDAGHNAVAWFVRRKCKIPPDGKLLEIGCGVCRFTKFLDESLVKNYIGLDVSKAMLDMCDANVKRIQGDIYKLPFADGTFKYIVSIYNFEHLRYLDEALTEVMRVMVDDGILIFSIPMEDGFLYNLGRSWTSKRLVEKKYGVDYLKIMREYEHPNTASEVINKINERFEVTDRLYLPFLIPSININLLAVFKAIKRIGR
jgi:ubiquinone/menaquinone biosynthesis C-methylase UbiE